MSPANFPWQGTNCWISSATVVSGPSALEDLVCTQLNFHSRGRWRGQDLRTSYEDECFSSLPTLPSTARMDDHGHPRFPVTTSQRPEEILTTMVTGSCRATRAFEGLPVPCFTCVGKMSPAEIDQFGLTVLPFISAKHVSACLKKPCTIGLLNSRSSYSSSISRICPKIAISMSGPG